jgi:hypothetical protein
MDDLNTPRTYRHSETGVVGVYHPRVALADRHLIEVADDAKSLAYLPIPSEAVADYLATREDQSDEGNSSTTKKRSK